MQGKAKTILLKIGITLVFLALAGVHLFYPGLEIDYITIFLTILAILPWWRDFRSIEFAGLKLTNKGASRPDYKNKTLTKEEINRLKKK